MKNEIRSGFFLMMGGLHSTTPGLLIVGPVTPTLEGINRGKCGECMAAVCIVAAVYVALDSTLDHKRRLECIPIRDPQAKKSGFFR